jgi:ParB/RepB/Spo0J family partition protein
MKNLENKKIEMKDLHIDPENNARATVDETALNSLTTSIRKSGLLSPVLVRPVGKDDKGVKQPFILIAGFRRFAAMKSIAPEGFIDCRVIAADVDPQDAAVLNLTENLNRENLNTYEIARGCHLLSTRYGMDSKEIAKNVKGMATEGHKNLSDKTVGNYLRLFKGLCPEVMTAWSAEHGKATQAELLKLVMIKDFDEQAEAWEDLCEGEKTATNGETDDTEGGNGGGTGTTTTETKRRPNMSDVKLMLKAIKESDHNAQWVEGALVVLEWSAGIRETVPGINLYAIKETNKATAKAESDAKKAAKKDVAASA